jgi:hypothetical protein
MQKHLKKTTQSGFVIGLAMIAVLTMSFFLITASMTTRASVKVSGNYTKSIGTFNIAEAGLARARPLIEGGNFTALLNTYNGINMIDPTPFNDGTYEVTMKDNDDGDSDPLADADNIIILSSIGKNSVGGKVEIDTHIQQVVGITFPPNPPGGPTAGLLCGADSDAKTQGSGSISGCDWALPPATPWPCTGSGCNGSVVGDTTSSPDSCDPGDSPLTGGYAIAAENDLDTSGGGFESGTTPVTTDGLGSSANCSEWKDTSDQLASLSASAPGVIHLSGSSVSSYAPNDCTNPMVFIINTTEPTFSISGDSAMCGVFVVASDTSISLSGTTTLIGIVFVMGNNTSIDFVSSGGTANIFGQVITNDIVADSGQEVQASGNTGIKYSAEAVTYAEQALSNAGVGGGGALLTVAWEEKY